MTEDLQGLTGWARLRLFAPDGTPKSEQVIKNLITDTGDLYYATRGASAVVPSAPADATKVTGMKLGTGTTAAAKNGAGAALVTYLSASNNAFDATFPVVNNLGAGAGVEIEYKTTWGAGDSTNAAITECVIVNEAIANNDTSTAAETISRIVFTAIDKQANDVLVIDWKHKFLGA